MAVTQHRSAWTAVIAATAFLLASGAAYRVVAVRYARVPGGATLSARALDRLALRLGDWRGRELPLNESVVRATDTDLHLFRAYARFGNAETVSLFIGYGQRIRDLLPHRPSVCYRGAGWREEAARIVQVKCADGSTVSGRMYHFERGGLANERIALLHYYIVDGEPSPDVSLLRSKAAWATSAAHYAVQVQIASIPVDGSFESAEANACAFAADAVPAIRTLLFDALQTAADGRVNSTGPSSPHEAAEAAR